MKSNTKKRLIAFMLCMVLVLSSATSAFADEPQNTDSQSQTEAVAEPAADEATGDEAAVNSSEQQQQEEQQPEQQQQEEQQPEQQQPETEAPTVEAPAEQPAAEEAQPIQQLTYEDDNVKITVDAVESGNIPEGATLSVTPVIKQEITDSMSDEEKAKAEELNDQYDHTEKKLNEKAENETYDIAGFLAYDITFVDADGNKMEPNGNVKISMDYKKTEIPEEAKKALEEKNDEQNLDVTVMHLEEDEQGEVKEVVDMVADETKEATVETTETKEVEKAAFVTNSFSTFTITWKKDSATYFKLTLHHVDEKGNELPTTLSSDATLNYNSDISFSDYVEIIDNYDYKYAKVDKISGKTVTNGSSGKRAKLTLYNGKDNKIETLSYSTTTKNIYLVYTAKSTGSTGSGTIEDTAPQLSHQKYIKKKDGNNYDLTLNVSSKKGTTSSKKKFDIVLIMDTSTSMSNNNKWRNSKTAVNKLIDTLSSQTTVDVNYRLVTFGTTAQIQTNWTTGETVKSTLSNYSIKEDQGTNYEDGLVKTKEALSSGTRADAEKIIVFLTDGQPTFYKSGTSYAGPGSSTSYRVYQHALDAAAKLKCDRIIPVGIGLKSVEKYSYDSYSDQQKVPDSATVLLQNVANKVNATTKDTVFNSDSSGSNLSTKFSEIAADIQKFPCKNVTIKDTLSEYVETTANTKLQLRMVKKTTANDHDTYENQGKQEIPLTDEDLISTNGKAVSINEKNLGTVKYDSAKKQVTWSLGENYELKDDIYYYITITDVKPTTSAEEKYKTDKAYTNTGDSNTDASADGNYGTMGNANDSSSGKKGFPSNDNTNHNSSVTYTNTKTNEPQTEDYQKPVIQVDVELIEGDLQTSKTAKVDNWDDRTYNITLNASSNYTKITSKEPEPVKIVFVLDTSGSMHFRSSLVPYKTCTTDALDKEETYYYVLSTDAATMYRVKYSDGNWYYIDDSKEGLGEKLTDNKERLYYTTNDANDRFYYLKQAATNFTTQLAQSSPNSEIALVTFNKTATEQFDFKNVGKDSAYITETINAMETSGGTHQNEGLDRAYKILNNDQNTSNLKRYVVLLTDGCPNGVTYDQITTSINKIKSTNTKLITVGVGLDETNTGLKAAKDYLQANADDNMAYNANDASHLNTIFTQILGQTTNSNTPLSVENATITDYIDPRFELTEETKKELNKDSNVTIAGDETSGYYITWKNQTINYSTDGKPTWTKTFQVKAKDTFIGDNNVTTNGAQSGITYKVTTKADYTTKLFPQPTVNVKSQLKVDNNTATIFKADSIPTDKDVLGKLFGGGDVTSYENGTLSETDFKNLIDNKRLTLEWFTKSDLTTSITPDEMEKITPDDTTSYYLKVTYKTNEPTSESKANTTKDSITYISGGGTHSTVAVNKNDDTKNYGIYKINVIKGEIKLTKQLATSSTEDRQFTFTLKKYDTDYPVTDYPVLWDATLKAYRPGTADEITNGTATSTITVTVSANKSSGEIAIKNLPRGNYKLSENDQTDYAIENVVIGDTTNCWSNNKNITGDTVTFTMGNNTNNTNVIVKDDQNHTWKQDSTDGAGQLGVVTYTNENVISNWGIQKTSSTNSNLKLKGARFELKSANNTYIGVSNQNGFVNWYTSYTDENTNTPLMEKMQVGTYTLKEIYAPVGYAKSTETWTVVIKKNGSLKSITSSAGTTIKTNSQTAGTTTITLYQFENTPLYDLPSAGGNGIYLYMIGGILLMFAAAWILYKNKCREVLER